MKREVYIDNQRVDMPAQSEVSIVYTNPVFVEASRISANRTSTFKVPLTARNKRICQYSDLPDAQTSYPRTVHRLDEYRGGLPVISGAQAKLLQIAGAYEFSVTWGVLKNFQQLLKVKLTELSTTRKIDWTKSTPFYRPGLPGALPDVGYLKMQTIEPYEALLEKDMQYHFPSVQVNYIIDMIQGDRGIHFAWQDEALRQEMRAYYIPLLTKHARPATDAAAPQTCVELAESWHPNAFYFWTRNDLGVLHFTGDSVGTSRLAQIKLKQKTYTLRIRLSLARPEGFSAWLGMKAVAVEIRIAARANGNYDRSVEQIITTSITDDKQVAVEKEIDIDGSSDGFTIVDTKVVLRGISMNRFQEVRRNRSTGWRDGFEGSLYIDIFQADDDVQFGNEFPIVPNLPSMSAMDFVKDLCFFFGLYLTAESPNTLRFNRTDSLAGRYATATLLDKYLLTQRPDKLSFTHADYARQNWMKYSTDDEVQRNADGYIAIDNQTLTDEQEMFELDFAPSDSLYGDDDDDAILEIFKKNYEEDTFDYQGTSLTPRIVHAKLKDDGYLHGVFDAGMDFQNRKATHYRVLSALLADAKVVEVDVYMDNYRLYRFRETDVFYFWGSYWLFMSGTVSNQVLAGKFIRFPVVG